MDIVTKLRQWADPDVAETARDGSLEPNDIRVWGQIMREAANEIERLRPQHNLMCCGCHQNTRHDWTYCPACGSQGQEEIE